jgi:hypothetical protein
MASAAHSRRMLRAWRETGHECEGILEARSLDLSLCRIQVHARVLHFRFGRRSEIGVEVGRFLTVVNEEVRRNGKIDIPLDGMAAMLSRKHAQPDVHLGTGMPH